MHRCRLTQPELAWSDYPLLGRETEINIFQQILTNMIEYSTRDITTKHLKPDYNTLVIK